jgi:hypothetical protein
MDSYGLNSHIMAKLIQWNYVPPKQQCPKPHKKIYRPLQIWDCPTHFRIHLLMLQVLHQMLDIFTAALHLQQPNICLLCLKPCHNSGAQFLRPMCHCSVTLVWQLPNRHL